MNKRLDLQEKEIKSTGEDSSVPAPVETKSNKRKLDKDQKGEDNDTKNVEDRVKTPQNAGSDKMVKENIERLFEGDDFSEEFKDKVSVVFEAALNEAVETEVSSIREELEEAYKAEVPDLVEEEIEKIAESVSSYMDIIVNKWLEENTLAIESSRKVEMAESIIDGIQYIFKENNMNIDQNDVDHVAELEEEVEKLTSTVNTLVESLALTKKTIVSYEKAEMLDELSEGLAETDKARLTRLTESIDYDNKEDFKKKVAIIKESFFHSVGSTTNTEDSLEDLNEEVEDNSPSETTDSSMRDLLSKLRPDAFVQS